MRDLFGAYTQYVLLGSAVVALLISSAFAAKAALPHIAFERTNQLAQILTIETELLKEWQQSKGLRSTLALNDSGADVSLLQRMLSEDTVAYPEKKITGYYGDLTKDAVLKFQGEYGLSQTGVVDEVTKNKLNEIFLELLCPEQTTVYPELFFRKITREQKLPLEYVPPSLENITHRVKTVGIACVRQDVVEPLARMFRAAERDGVQLAVTSGYRRPEIQKYLYDFWIQLNGPEARDAIAEPGASEHQLGTTLDLTDASIGYAGVDPRFARSSGGKWLAKNAHVYGFVMSYPKGKESVTGYTYEPWHWRFVGEDVARAMRERETTFNEAAFEAEQKPFPKAVVSEGVSLGAHAVFSTFIDREGKGHVLLEKNKDVRLPIASVTKLMVALIASETLRQETVVVSKSALQSKGISGSYRVGDTFLVDEALHGLLIGSHNEIAISMAEQVGMEQFIEQMNEKARVLGLKNTHFVNVTGLDPEPGKEEMNYSSAADIATLLAYIFEHKTHLASILGKSEYTLTMAQGARKIAVRTTNDLLATHNTALRVLGGKTGETPKAKMNLAIVSEAPASGRIVSVVLSSDDSFYDMRKVLQYLQDSFVW